MLKNSTQALAAKKSFELKKHVGTIQCSNTLSLLQRKIANALLFHAYRQLLKEDEHAVEIRHLCRMIGYDSNDHKLIKSALRKLLSTVLEWNVVHDKDGEASEVWSASSILASVSIEASVCRYAYSPRMKQLLHTPSMYGRVDLIVQNRFKSSYALALYENCVRYQDLPYTAWFEMAVFRKLMGVMSDKYQVFRDFKRRVVDKAVAEVNTHAPLVVTPEYKRAQRQVVAIRFRIEAQKPKAMVVKPVFASSELKVNLQSNWAFNDSQADELLKSYPATFIQAQMAQIKQSKPYQSGAIKNRRTYLLAALKANCSRSQLLTDHTQTEVARTIEHEKRRHKTQFYAYFVQQLKSQVPASDYELLVKAFEAHLSTQFAQLLWKYYQRDGLQHRAVAAELIQFVQQKHKTYFELCDDFDAYVHQQSNQAE